MLKGLGKTEKALLPHPRRNLPGSHLESSLEILAEPQPQLQHPRVGKANPLLKKLDSN